MMARILTRSPGQFHLGDLAAAGGSEDIHGVLATGVGPGIRGPGLTPGGLIVAVDRLTLALLLGLG